MSRSVRSKTVRHDCQLLGRERDHLKTLVFLLQLLKLNRHKLGSVKGDGMFFLLGFARIIVQNRLLFPMKPKNVRCLLARETAPVLRFPRCLALIMANVWDFTSWHLTCTSAGEQLTPIPADWHPARPIPSRRHLGFPRAAAFNFMHLPYLSIAPENDTLECRRRTQGALITAERGSPRILPQLPVTWGWRAELTRATATRPARRPCRWSAY